MSITRLGWLAGCPLRWLLVYSVLGWLAALAWAASDVMDEIHRWAAVHEPARDRTNVDQGAAWQRHHHNTTDAYSVEHFN